MMSFKSFLLLSLSIAAITAYVFAQVAPGSNAYLPPTKNGYDYPEPNKPFQPSQPGRPGPGPGPRPPGPQRNIPGQPADDHVHVPGMPFDFEYAVQDPETANDYAHKASSDGDVVTGEYRVQLPDGRTQVVRYMADWKTGYHADVSYEGEAQFPQGPTGGRGGGGGGAAGYKY
ncbi:pro-resilin [Drosophila sulfurigaster albostrigata]|uniref:Pro-resilin n=1 Tax=Drosophila albomicans TaxID=7291 RepID=A0A6P8YF54_DROAB|nr:pro-resilin [Drosophila albomicans]XP_060655999.1 pro-resilin [Drosophila nasuta]XP_062131514.1 pro-resilin [Drosophila sulfurigaster albostrigata]